ncbi:MAG: hypothetical protein ACU85U_00530 [Gammaproteobacteria bacterium]|jgi:hypothetical protein
MKSKLAAPLVLALTLVTGGVNACDVDADCGAGGTCIKREKRARGVCYGGNFNETRETATPPVNMIDPLSMPTNRPADACMVTEECPAGMECVITGIWGRCTVL